MCLSKDFFSVSIILFASLLGLSECLWIDLTLIARALLSHDCLNRIPRLSLLWDFCVRLDVLLFCFVL